MTREEAVYRIENHIAVHRIGLYPHVKLGEALNMAIEALKEPEIVHCKDCVYWKAARIGICGLAGYFIGERGYCLYGKKAGENDDRRKEAD